MTAAILSSLAARAREQRQAPIISNGTVSLTALELWLETTQLATKLVLLARRPGVIAYCLQNGIAAVALDLALTRLDFPGLALPSFFTPEQQAHALRETGAVLLITDDAADENKDCSVISVQGQLLYCRELPTRAVQLPVGTAKITYTSGTTGKPKGVCLSQAGIERVAQALVTLLGRDYAGLHCAVLPLAVLLETVAGLYPTILAGGCYHVPPPAALGLGQSFAPDFAALTQGLADCGATSTILVPELLRGLVGSLAQRGARLPALKLVAVGGAAISPALLNDAAALGLPVYQGYGLSECGSVVAFNRPGFNRLGSVGRLLPHLAAEIAGDGEVIVTDTSGAMPAFLGYIGEKRRGPHWFTGDLGRFDDDGYLYVDGRKSSVLITSFGRNIAPEWIESLLLAEPAVAQAFVFGDGQPVLGALLVPARPSMGADDLAAAVARVNAGLPAYAGIAHWSGVPAFTPANGQLTGNGRLRRAAILAAHADTIGITPIRESGLFDRLVAETMPAQTALAAIPQIRDGLAGQISRATYLAYLAEAYHHVRQTTRLMRLAQARLPDDKAWLHAALDGYIADETGHENWILDDIAAAGGDADAVRRGRPRPATASMLAYAEDYIDRINPVGLLGMIYVLEGTSIALAGRGAKALMASLDLPADCFRYLLSHGTLDLAHIAELKSLVNQVDIPADQAAILEMAQSMFGLFGNLFRSIPHTSPNHPAPPSREPQYAI